MGGTGTAAFDASAEAIGAAVSRTTATEFPSLLETIIREPALGTPLPFEGVSYDGIPVTSPPTGADLVNAKTGVTAGKYGITEYGSVLLEETGQGEELLGLYPELHVVVVAESTIVEDLPAALDEVADRLTDYPMDTIIATGPSATADMGELVVGVHGPHDVHIIILEDR